MRINRLLQVFLLLGAIYLVVASFVLIYKGISIDPLLLLSVIGYVLMLFFLLEIKGKSEIDTLMFIVVFISINWVAIRAIHLVTSIQSINYRYLVDTGTSGLSFTMFMITISTVCLVAGLKIGYNAVSDHRNQINNLAFSENVHIEKYKSIIFYFIIIMCVNAYINREIIQSGSGVWSYVLRIIFGKDFALLLFAYVTILTWNGKSITVKLIVTFAIVGFITIRTLGGSKGGIYQFYEAIFMAIAVLNPRWRINFKLLITGSILFPLAVVLFFYGHGIRWYNTVSIGETVSIVNYIDNYDKIAQYTTGDIDLYGSKIEMLSKRLSMLDYIHVMYHLDPIRDYLTPLYQTKVMINALMPGSPFDGASLYSALLFKAAYGYGTYSEATSNYHSDMIPMFGWLYVNYKSISIILITILGYFMGLIYHKIINLKSSWLWVYKLLAVYAMSNILFGMGIDAIFQQLVFYMIIPFFFLRQTINLNESQITKS